MQYKKAKGSLCRPSFLTGGKRNSKIYLLPFCFLLIGGGLTSCSSVPLSLGGINLGNFSGNVTKISDIRQNSNVADTVYLQGQVANRAPFLANGAYKIQDATGTIWVLTNQTLPNIGDEVLIKGQPLFQSIPISGQEAGEVYIQEQQQLRRRAGQQKPLVVPQERS